MTARRFPVGLTISTAIALAILCGLGVWQLKRLAWKTDLLARIEALKTTPAVPLTVALARAARGEDVDFTRVSVVCGQAGQAPPRVYLFGLSDGRPGWRALSPCILDSRAIVVDRGFADSPEATRPPAGAPALPVSVVGILRRPDPLTWIQEAVTYAENDDIGYQLRRHAIIAATPSTFAVEGFVLVAESETPKPAGVIALPLPTDIPNRHLEYALTWFGLAGALVAVYAAMILRRTKTA